ncbi:MAG: membrane protein insertion efficiency factor YidD, partial [Candidatus Magasanikbacteria bacterium RIFCSPHIGHO2_01_FULL_50_8]
MNFLFRVPQRASMQLIRLYQKTISPDHGFFRGVFPFGYCKFQPSCSEYGYQALARHGFVVGWLKALWRIMRCNPFTRGGADP